MSKPEMHHANWTRRDWQHARDHSLREMRSHAGLIVPVFPANHRLLHIEVEPTPMPIHPVAVDLLEELGEFKTNDNRIETFKRAARFLLAEAMTHPKPYYAESANRLGLHYVHQLGYIALTEEAAESALLERYPKAA